MCNGWIIHLTFSNLIEQSIHIQIDWKLCRECNNPINLCLLSFNIQQFKSLIESDFFNWPPLVRWQNDEWPTSQPIHLKICSEWNNQINLCLPSFNICNDERYLVVVQVKEWTDKGMVISINKWTSIGRDVQTMAIFGPKWPKMHILDQFWPFLGQKS